MTTVTYERPAGTTAPGFSFARVLKSELIKFRSLRSTWITYAVALLVADGLGALIAAGNGSRIHNHAAERAFDPVQFSLFGIMFAQLAIGVVGVMFATGEYATGSIRASITAVPKRTPVLFAKGIVFGLVTLLVSLALTFVAFFAGQAILSNWNLGVSISHDGALRAVLEAAFYLACIGLMGLGLGFALRNTGGAIATLFGIVFVIPILSSALPQSWQEHFTKYLPTDIAHMLIGTGPASPHTLSNGWGMGMLAIYAVASLALGLLVLRRRDV